MKYPFFARFQAPLFAGLALLALAGCTSSAANPEPNQPILKESNFQPSREFGEYWYAGKAELNRYDLTQARYGEYHKGDAVLIFVAEDINTVQQVKHDGSNGPKDPVLKVNFNRKFWTGIYPYSTLMSVNSPVDGTSPAWKVSGSCEEWCGHTYMQLNRRGKQYAGVVHSYFPGEGDQEWKVEPEILEDEIWTRIRLNPGKLPIGNVKVFPGVTYVRLLHQPETVRNATGALTQEGDLKVYTLTYSDINRVLTIKFQKEFPFEIMEWEEKFMNGFGKQEWMTTKAVRTNSMQLDYWNHHNPEDSTLRKELGMISAF